METKLEKFYELKGQTLKSVDVNDEKDLMTFTLENGDKYALYHSQDCCESVSIEDIVGDLQDLVGVPLLMADEASSTERPEGVAELEYHDDSETWTFYKLATIKGYVTIRWYGSSNGYYSESVDFGKVR